MGMSQDLMLDEKMHHPMRRISQSHRQGDILLPFLSCAMLRFCPSAMWACLYDGYSSMTGYNECCMSESIAYSSQYLTAGELKSDWEDAMVQLELKKK